MDPAECRVSQKGNEDHMDQNTAARVEVVVGAQYGSEGKGHVTAQRVLHNRDELGLGVFNVRVAGPNAGHTVYSQDGQKFAFRALPVGAALGEDIICVIAAGSEIDMTVLEKEITEVAEHFGTDNHLKLWVDAEATILTGDHIQEEQDSDLTDRLGSTAKGIGAARAQRIWRKAERVQDVPWAVALIESWGAIVGNTARMMMNPLNTPNAAIIIEGTQGYGLGLHAGAYPQCTSSDCRAIDFLAMAGINPWHPSIEGLQIWIATRVYPIRVAGNSGPMKGETSWDELQLPEEHTTVTQKVRRVGEWDGELVRRAVAANGGGNGVDYVKLAITMADQKYPELEGQTNFHEFFGSGHQDHEDIQEWLIGLQVETDCRVGMITTSPSTAITL